MGSFLRAAVAIAALLYVCSLIVMLYEYLTAPVIEDFDDD